MIHETTWHPDTCVCVLVYQWDDAEPDETRVHTFIRAAQTCPLHEGLSLQELVDTVLVANRLKNSA